VDLAAIGELDRIERRNGELVTGAMLRQRTFERWPELRQEVPLAAAALPHVGHREIRNRGTVGGSIAHADPSAELGLIAATLGATIEAVGSDGDRELPAEGFVRGPFQTELATDELLTAVRWPVAGPDDQFAFAEVARRHGDFALCGVAVHVRRGDGRVQKGRVGLLGVAATPVVHDVTAMLERGMQPPEVAEELAASVDPPSDMHASAGYRRRLVRALVAQCLERAR
jgi:carbon-monoxide dehydrogenase medium subunit